MTWLVALAALLLTALAMLLLADRCDSTTRRREGVPAFTPIGNRANDQ